MMFQPLALANAWVRKRYRYLLTYVLPLVLCILVTGMIWVVTAHELHVLRDKAFVAENLKNAANVRSYEDQVLRAIETLDQGLLSIRHNNTVAPGASSINDLLQALRVNRDFVDSASIVDAKGVLIATTRMGMNLDVADRDYFQFHATHPEDTLRIGAPTLGRLTGKWIIPFTRRISTPDGGFAGVVFIGAEPTFLAASQEHVIPGQGGSMALIGLDGITRARNNNGKVSFGDNASQSQLFKEIVKGKTGQYQARAASDGVLRAASYRVFDNYPLVVVAASSLDGIDASLRDQKIIYLSVAIVATVLFLSFVAVSRTALLRSRRDLEKLRESRETLRATINASPTPMALSNNLGHITYLNAAFVATFGYTLDDIPSVDHWWPLAYPEASYRESVVQRWTEAIRMSDAQGAAFEPMEVHIRCKDGSTKYIMVASAPLMKKHKPDQVITLHDITAVYETQKALSSLVNEKNALLREVHHRVKNNLQVITSLLRLESSRSTHTSPRSVLDTMHGRIRSMALMHESLYQSNSFAAIDLSVYLRQLASEAMRAMSTPGAQVALDLELAPMWVTMDQATSCGLLVNELMSNAIKHGFKDGMSGRITVRLHAGPGTDMVTLEVEDDGAGLPPDWEIRSQNSLGLQLVGDLVQQLDGLLTVGPAPLARFTVVFTLQSTTGPTPLTS